MFRYAKYQLFFSIILGITCFSRPLFGGIIFVRNTPSNQAVGLNVTIDVSPIRQNAPELLNGENLETEFLAYRLCPGEYCETERRFGTPNLHVQPFGEESFDGKPVEFRMGLNLTAPNPDDYKLPDHCSGTRFHYAISATASIQGVVINLSAPMNASKGVAEFTLHEKTIERHVEQSAMGEDGLPVPIYSTALNLVASFANPTVKITEVTVSGIPKRAVQPSGRIFNLVGTNIRGQCTVTVQHGTNTKILSVETFQDFTVPTSTTLVVAECPTKIPSISAFATATLKLSGGEKT